MHYTGVFSCNTGAIFDSGVTASRSAFLYEVDKYNNGTAGFKLHAQEQINKADNFELCKASE